jgi:hypothetical protein
MRLLAETFADQSVLFRFLPFYKQIAEVAAAVMIGTVADLPVIAAKLLPCCGFKRFSHVFLIRRPASADIGTADIVVVASRGEKQPILLVVGSTKQSQINPTVIAKRLISDAEQKLHVFAETRSDGWVSLIGDENWAERPAVK